MPTQTKFVCPSGVINVDLSGIFAELNGGTSYNSATNFKVGANDINTLFHASTVAEDRPSFNTGFKVNGTDLSAIFRRRGYAGINITSQPSNQIVTNNTSATFSITATAAGAPTYQWYGPSGLISGATNSSYTISTATMSNDGSYYCAVSYAGSTVNSNSALLKIKPYITSTATVPSPMILSNGSFPVAVQCYALGSGTLYYTWYLDGNMVAGESNQPANLTNGRQYVFTLNLTTDGTYTCKVTSNYDSTGVYSSGLAAVVQPYIISNPSSQTQNSGSTATFNISADGSPTLSYQWYKNGGLIGGAIGSSYTTPTLTGSDNQSTYYCVVSSSVSGTSPATSSSATLTVNYAPTIGSVAVNSQTVTSNLQSFSIGNSENFTLSASGVDDGQPNATGGWYKWNGSNAYDILLSTSLSYTLTQSDDSTEYYRFILTNSRGTAQSHEIEIITG